MTPPETAPPLSSEPVRLAGLDGLRAMAAGLVVVHHAGFLSGLTADGGAGRFVARADVGVVVFFVLSGFLLGTPFARALVRGSTRPSAGRFLRRRALRILPAYWVALGVMVAGGAIAVGGAVGFAWCAALVQVYDPDRFGAGIVQSWSLATELVFYVALVPVAALAGRLLRRARDVDGRAQLLLGALAMTYAGSFAFRLAIEGAEPSWATTSSVWLPALADHFAVGLGLAVLRAWADERAALDVAVRRIGSRTAWWWLGALVAFVVVATQLDLALGFEVVTFERESLRQLLYGLVGLGLVAPVALAPTADDAIRRVLARRPVEFLGRVSYGVYLWHVAWMVWLLRWTDAETFDASFPGLLAGGAAASIAVAWVSHRFLEAPLLARFGGRAVSRRRRVAATPPAVGAPDP